MGKVLGFVSNLMQNRPFQRRLLITTQKESKSNTVRNVYQLNQKYETQKKTNKNYSQVRMPCADSNFKKCQKFSSTFDVPENVFQDFGITQQCLCIQRRSGYIRSIHTVSQYKPSSLVEKKPFAKYFWITLSLLFSRQVHKLSTMHVSQFKQQLNSRTFWDLKL